MSQEHLSMELLLAVRDGERSEPEQVAAHAHVASCEACRSELDRLHQRTAMLRALPTLTPARSAFPAVQRQMADDLRHRWQRRFAIGGLAAAAALAIAVVGNDLAHPAELDASEQLETAMTSSEVLERALNAWRPETRAMDAHTAEIVIELEDRIADVDGRLERARRLAEQVELWQERVGLMSALVDVHLTKATNVGL